MFAIFGQFFQFFFISAYSLLNSGQTLVVAITAVIIVAELILLAYFLKGRQKKKEVVAIIENEETVSFRSTIEKIEDLEAEKKTLISQIDDLKKTADAKADALESEIIALREEMNARKNSISKSKAEPKLKKNNEEKESEK